MKFDLKSSFFPRYGERHNIEDDEKKNCINAKTPVYE